MRDDFERYGSQVIALALGLGVLPIGGMGGGHPTHALQTVVLHQADAAAWLTEKRDEEERDKTRTEFIEWAILIFVVVGVIADIAIAGHEFGWFG
jgi:hypothetical protein